MSERLETLKKARERMIEDRDAHAKVLAAPFDRDKKTGTRMPRCSPLRSIATRPSGPASNSPKSRPWSTPSTAPSSERKPVR